MKTFITLATIVWLIAGSFFAIITVSEAKEVVLRIGSAKIGSSTYTECSVFSACINKRLGPKGITMHSIPTESTIADIRLFARGDFDLATCGARDMRSVWFGTGPFAKEPPYEIKPYQGLWKPPATMVFVTRADRDDIKTVRDLVGKKVYAFYGAMRETTMAVLEALGIDAKIISVESMALGDGLKMGTLDATVFVHANGGANIPPWCSNLDVSANIKYLPFSEADKKIIPSKVKGVSLDYLNVALISKKNMQNFPSNPLGYTVIYTYFAGQTLSEKLFYTLLRTWIDNAEEDLIPGTPAFQIWFKDPIKWTVTGIETNPDLPIHPGLAKLLKEKGAWKEEWKVGEIKEGKGGRVVKDVPW